MSGLSGPPGTVTPSPSPTATPTPYPTPTPTSGTGSDTDVSADLLAALNAALDDERKAEATYLAVLDKLGPVMPFSNILQAERKHVEMLLPLYSSRGLDVPVNSWEGKGEAADTPLENCEIGVAAEEANIAMYDRLFETLTDDDEDVRVVFVALQAASRDNHLPAFKQCAGIP